MISKIKEFDKEEGWRKFYVENPTYTTASSKPAYIPRISKPVVPVETPCIDCGAIFLKRAPRSVRCLNCRKQWSLKIKRGKYVPYSKWTEEAKNRFRLYRSKWWKHKSTEFKRKYRMRTYRIRLHTGERLPVGAWEDIKKQYGYTCLKCGRTEPTIKLSRDHIIPLSRGGRNVIENIQPLCIACNSSKFTKSIDFRTKVS